MPIPESQLQTWTNQGATVTAQRTHEEVSKALLSPNSPLVKRGLVLNKDYEIYLQGSYRNSTNIYGDSDVDVVVQLNNAFERNISKLSAAEQTAYKSSVVDAKYGWRDFRADVLLALQLHYGPRNVIEGNKCINCRKEYLLEADVVPCILFRDYKSFGRGANDYVEGMKFYTLRENRPVVNYPKQHINNGAGKNSLANGEYKPSIRMFKNARNYLKGKHMVTDGMAPSYFIEGLMFNVPPALFTSNRQKTYEGVVTWLSQVRYDEFLCQNGQVLLFGTTPEQWNQDDARRMVAAWKVLWDRWGMF